MSRKARVVAAVEALLDVAKDLPEDITVPPRDERLRLLMRFADAENKWDDAVDGYLTELRKKGAGE